MKAHRFGTNRVKLISGAVHGKSQVPATTSLPQTPYHDTVGRPALA